MTDLTAMSHLRCYQNELTELKGVSGLIELERLLCYGNHLETLDLSSCSKLQDLFCDGNTIDLKDGTIKAESGGNVHVQFGKMAITNDTSIPFTMTALPDNGHTFDDWTGLPDSGNSKDNPVSFTPGTGYTYTAHFVSTKSDNNTTLVAGVTLDQSELHLYTNKEPKTGTLIATVSDFGTGRVTVGLAYTPATTFTPDGATIFTTDGATTFMPDAAITRGTFVTALGRLAGIDPAAYPSSGRFTDVPAAAYYAPYAEWAAANGIVSVSGTGENSFSPGAPITREQLAAIMQRYADKLGYTLPIHRLEPD